MQLVQWRLSPPLMVQGLRMNWKTRMVLRTLVASEPIHSINSFINIIPPHTTIVNILKHSLFLWYMLSVVWLYLLFNWYFKALTILELENNPGCEVKHSLIPRLSRNANLYHEEFHTCTTSMFAIRSVRAWEQGWSNMQEVGVCWEKHAGGFEVLVIKFLSQFPRMSLALVPRLPPKYRFLLYCKQWLPTGF